MKLNHLKVMTYFRFVYNSNRPFDRFCNPSLHFHPKIKLIKIIKIIFFKVTNLQGELKNEGANPL